MNRRDFIKTAGMAAAGLAYAPLVRAMGTVARQQRKSNIVFISRSYMGAALFALDIPISATTDTVFFPLDWMEYYLHHKRKDSAQGTVPTQHQKD